MRYSTAFLSAFLLLSLEALYSAQADAAPPANGAVQVTVTASKSCSGVLKSIDTAGGNPVLRLADANILLNEVVRIDFNRSPPLQGRPPATVLLSDQSELRGSLTKATSGAVCVDTGIFPPAEIPLEKVLAIIFPASFKTTDAFEFFRFQLREQVQDDTVYTVDNNKVTGIFDAITPEQATITTDSLGKMTFAREKIHGLSLVQLEEHIEPSGLTTHCVLSNGSFIKGTITALSPETCTLKNLAGTFTFPTASLCSILVSGGKWIFLDTLTPSSKEEKSFIGTTTWSMKRGMNVLGGPLQCKDRQYRRGLGVHSFCRVTYRLEKRYQRFEALAGLDDSAVDEKLDTRLGNVVFRVYVDGRKQFDSGNSSWNDALRAVSVTTTGAEELSLEVDYGAGFHVLDRANWIEARLLRQ